MTTLILIRHGETEKNVAEKIHSSDDPEPLTSKGRIQIKKTAKELKKMKVFSVYSSDENRAQESAMIVSKYIDVPVRKIKGLQERNWDELSGKSWDEIKIILDPMSLDERYNYVPPSGESWKEFEKRLIRTIKQILKENLGKVVVVVSHGGSIGALMPFLLEVSKEESFKYDPDNASVTIFNYKLGNFEKIKINDTSHLQPLKE